MSNIKFICATDPYNEAVFPQYKKKIKLLKDQTAFELKKTMLLKDQTAFELKKTMKKPVVNFKTIYKIPIVFHVVNHTDEEDIEKKQILKQVKSLNKDFRNKNLGNPLFSQYRRERELATDSKIEFFLPKKDPHGNRTVGITRTYTRRKSFKPVLDSGNTPLNKQPVKSKDKGGCDAWDTTKYLNVWICKLTLRGGYAQYPPEEHHSRDAHLTDGIVVDYRCIGKGGTALFPNDEGRTLTHEVGHWLGLYHLWGPDGYGGCYSDDRMIDIPPQRGKQEGCPRENGEYSNEQSCEYPPPLVMNYMDYWYDKCKLMFTKCQVKAMRACLTSKRKKLIWK